MFKRLSADFAVSPQISIDDVAQAAADGITLIVNNRPDGEDPSAPQGDAIAAAAKAAGVSYVAIPIGHGGFSAGQLDALDRAVDDVQAQRPGMTLAYCRSGTRSAHLWALAQARKGADVDGIVRATLNAGYDVTPLRPMMTALASG